MDRKRMQEELERLCDNIITVLLDELEKNGCIEEIKKEEKYYHEGDKFKSPVGTVLMLTYSWHESALELVVLNGSGKGRAYSCDAFPISIKTLNEKGISIEDFEKTFCQWNPLSLIKDDE